VSRKHKRIHRIGYQNRLRDVFLLQVSNESPALVDLDTRVQENADTLQFLKEHFSRTNKIHKRSLNLIHLLQMKQHLTPITLKVRPSKLFTDRAQLRWQRSICFSGARFQKPSLQPPRQSTSALLLSIVHSIQWESSLSTVAFWRDRWYKGSSDIRGTEINVNLLWKEQGDNLVQEQHRGLYKSSVQGSSWPAPSPLLLWHRVRKQKPLLSGRIRKDYIIFWNASTSWVEYSCITCLN